MSLADNLDAPITLLDRTVSIPPYVVHRIFVTETVILNLETGKYHGLNPTAGRILDCLSRTGSPRMAAAVLAEEFGRPLEDLEADVTDFCAALAKRGLIDVHAGTPA